MSRDRATTGVCPCTERIPDLIAFPVVRAGIGGAAVEAGGMEPVALFLCNVITPLLLGCVVIAPWKSPRPWMFWARGAVGLGLAVIAAEAGKRYVVWPGHPTFPSGHETFALAAGTLLVRHDRRWLAPVLPVVLLLAWALVRAHYHHPEDVAGALLTGPPLALLAARLLPPWRGPQDT